MTIWKSDGKSRRKHSIFELLLISHFVVLIKWYFEMCVNILFPEISSNMIFKHRYFDYISSFLWNIFKKVMYQLIFHALYHDCILLQILVYTLVIQGSSGYCKEPQIRFSKSSFLQVLVHRCWVSMLVPCLYFMGLNATTYIRPFMLRKCSHRVRTVDNIQYASMWCKIECTPYMWSFVVVRAVNKWKSLISALAVFIRICMSEWMELTETQISFENPTVS